MTPAPREPARTGHPEWQGWPPGMAILAMLTAFLLATMFGGVILAASGDVSDPPPGASIAATILQDVILIAVAVGFASMVARPAPSQFGLRATRFWRAVGWCGVAYVTYAVLGFAFLQAVGADQTDDIPQQLGADESVAAAIGVALLVSVLAPVVEEVFFRGYLLGAFLKWGVPAAVVLNGVLFGLVHAGGSDVAYLLPLAVFGGVLCLLRLKTGSLYPCIALHWVNNCVALSVALSWSWQVPVLFAASLALIVLLVLAATRFEPRSAAVPAAG